MKDISVENRILFTSSRVTVEIVTKGDRDHLPVVIIRAAASCLAIYYAADRGITLTGFARGDRMNISTWPNRIKQG